MKVLIIEDNESAAANLSEITEKESAECIIASTCEMAGKLQEETTFNLVLLSYNLLNSNALECLRRIRKQNIMTQLPVLITGVKNGESRIHEFLETGANDFISKPYDEWQLRLKIRNLLQLQLANEQFLQNETRLQESIKGFNCLEQLIALVDKYDKVEDILQNLVFVLQNSFINPDGTGFRIKYDGHSFQTPNFKSENCLQSAQIKIQDKTVGIIEASKTEGSNGDLTEQEKTLIVLVTRRLGYIIERLQQQYTYRNLFDTLNEAIIKADYEGVITEANHAAADLCGYETPDQLIGTHMKEIYAHPEIRDETLKNLENEGDMLHNFEFLLKQQNGNIIPTFCNIRLLRDSNGEYIGTLGSLRDISNVRVTQEKLKESEFLHRQILSNISDAVFVTDQNGQFTFICPNVQFIFGYELVEVKKMNKIQNLIPDLKELHQNAIKQDNEIRKFECLANDKSNNQLTLLVTVKSIHLNKPVFLYVCRDITEEKRRTRKIDQLNRRLEASFVAGDMAWWEMELPSGEISFHENKTSILGRNQEKFPHYSDFMKIVHPDDYEVAMQAVRDHMSGLKTVYECEYRIKHSKGYYLWFHDIGRITHREGDNIKLTGIVTDITERKRINIELNRAKEQAEKNEKDLREAQKLSHVGSWSYDPVTQQAKWSDEMFCIWGIDPKSGAPTYNEHKKLIHPDDWDNFDSAVIDAVNKGIPYKLELRIVRPDKKVKTIITICEPVIDSSSGKLIGLKGTNQDITERKSVELKLQESNIELKKAKERAEESNRLKTEFLNNMSHEVRTPMNGIIGFSRMLDKANISDEKRRNYSKIIQNSSHQLLNIIDDILEMSALETNKEGVVDEVICLNDLIMELFSIFSLRSKERNIPIYVKKRWSDNKSCIVSDKSKLHKILSNLLDNAIKFTNEGFIEIGYFLQGDNLIIYVKDTGVGVSGNNQKMIFERFSQEEKALSRKFGGLGLGLSISKESAQLLGGNITLESEKGKGSTFFVSIPHKPANKPNETKKAVSGENTLTMKRRDCSILIAEDEEVNYLYIEALFEEETEHNFTLIHAKNGQEAVELCNEDRQIDLVLMDIKMPVMNGHEATKKIKSKFPELPVIVQTAYSTEEDKALALKWGCDDFISKPIDKELLFDKINNYLNFR